MASADARFEELGAVDETGPNPVFPAPAAPGRQDGRDLGDRVAEGDVARDSGETETADQHDVQELPHGRPPGRRLGDWPGRRFVVYNVLTYRFVRVNRKQKLLNQLKSKTLC